MFLLHLWVLVTLDPGGAVGTGEANMALQHPGFFLRAEATARHSELKKFLH